MTLRVVLNKVIPILSMFLIFSLLIGLNVFTALHYRTALMIAAKHDRPELVKVLLQHGADTIHKDLDGRAALEYAMMRGRYAMHTLQGDESCQKLIEDAIVAKESKQMKVSLSQYLFLLKSFL